MDRQLIRHNYRASVTTYEVNANDFLEAPKGWFNAMLSNKLRVMQHNLMSILCSTKKIVKVKTISEQPFGELLSTGGFALELMMTKEYMMSKNILEVYSEKMFNFFKQMAQSDSNKCKFYFYKSKEEMKNTPSPSVVDSQSFNVLLDSGKETLLLYSYIVP